MDNWIELIIYAIVLGLGGLSQLFKAFRSRSREIPKPGPAPRPVTGRPSVPFDEAVFSSPDVSKKRLVELRDKTRRLLERGRDVDRGIRLVGGATVLASDSLAEDVLGPLSSIETELSSAVESPGALTADDASALEGLVARSAAVLELLEGIVNQRTGPANAVLLDRLDRAAQALLDPFLRHARARRIPYPTRHAAVSLVPTGTVPPAALSEAALASVAVDPKMSETPVGWMALPRDVMRDVLVSTPRLASSVHSAIQARHLADFQFAQVTENQAVSGLVARWMPRLFFDAGACLMLGPAYVAGLRSEIELERLSAMDSLTAWIDGEAVLLPELPAHVRMMAAARVLQHLGMGDEAQRRWKQWNDKVGAPTQLVVRLPSGLTRELPLTLVQDAVLKSVDAMVKTPFGPLSGTALREIPGVSLRLEGYERMVELRDALLEGDAEREHPRVVLGAALLAVERSETREGRVGRAALRCLDVSAVARVRAPLGGLPAEESLREMLRSPRSIADAVVLGATLSPRPGPGLRGLRRAKRSRIGLMMR